MAEKNLNIQKVKDNTTLSRTTISNLYNNNGAGVQFDTMKQLCKLLKCQPGDLFTYVDISVEFKEISNDSYETGFDINTAMSTFKYDNEIDQTKYKMISEVLCKLEYENIITQFAFRVFLHFKFESELELVISGNTSKEFISNLRNLNLPYFVEDYVKDRFHDFTCQTWSVDGWGPVATVNSIEMK